MSPFYMRLIYPAYLLANNLNINYKMVQNLTPLFDISLPRNDLYSFIEGIIIKSKNLTFDIDPYEIYFKHINLYEQIYILYSIKQKIDVHIYFFYKQYDKAMYILNYPYLDKKDIKPDLINKQKYLKYKLKYMKLKSQL